MTTNYAVPDNPYVTLQNKVIKINCDKKYYEFHIDDVAKMYLKKRKRSLFSLSRLDLFSKEHSYYLHVRTKDKSEVRISVKAHERQFILAIISYPRNRPKPTPERPTRRIPGIAETAAA